MEIYCNNFGLFFFFPNLLLWTTLMIVFDIWFWTLMKNVNILNISLRYSQCMSWSENCCGSVVTE